MAVCIGLEVLNLVRIGNKKTSLRAYSLKLLNILVVVLKTVFVIPVWETVLLMVQARSMSLTAKLSPAVAYAFMSLAILSAVLFLHARWSVPAFAIKVEFMTVTSTVSVFLQPVVVFVASNIYGVVVFGLA